MLAGLLERRERDRVARRWAVERLRDVLAAGGPDIVFQPVVDLRDGSVPAIEWILVTSSACSFGTTTSVLPSYRARTSRYLAGTLSRPFGSIVCW